MKSGDVVDNRYMLSPADFPSATLLRERGITRAVYVVEDLDETEREEDDLQSTLLGWQAAGISLHMVDLSFLMISGSPPRWDEHLSRQRLVVVERRRGK